MPLIIENGTGVTGADSFVTVAECEAFALAYFGASLAGSPTAKEGALRRAFVFMSGLRWRADLWPTFGGTIPQGIKNGQHVFARAEFQSVGVLSPSVTLAGAKVLTKVGSLEWTPKDGDNTVEAARPVVTMGFDFIRPWLEYQPGKIHGPLCFS